ncbi:hypothetical protein C8T65DRAFT_745674 [Cerioporus squamosus]|nr:hypothetical protein C8T65DRAFT_745674 [Cerioporus squamosus]
MAEVNPIYLGGAGFLSLILAYLIFVKDVPPPTEPADDRNPFAATEVVRPTQTTLLEYTPRHPPHGNASVPLVARVFNHPEAELAEALDVTASNSTQISFRVALHFCIPFPPLRPLPNVTRFFCSSIQWLQHVEVNLVVSPLPRTLSSLFFPGDVQRTICRPALAERNLLLVPARKSARAALTPASASPTPGKHHRSAKVKANGKYLLLTNHKTRQCSKNKNFPNVLPDGSTPITAYFRLSGNEPLDQPPHDELLKRGLKTGDVHIHYANASRQIWIYLQGADGSCAWESVDAGYVRSVDGRSLNLTRNGNPNFTGDNWASRMINEKINKELRQGKGKMVATGTESSDEAENDSAEE